MPKFSEALKHGLFTLSFGLVTLIVSILGINTLKERTSASALRFRVISGL